MKYATHHWVADGEYDDHISISDPVSAMKGLMSMVAIDNHCFPIYSLVTPLHRYMPPYVHTYHQYI